PALGAVPLLDPRDGALGTRGVVVADDDRLEEVAASGDLGDGIADTARPHQEDSHGLRLVAARPAREGTSTPVCRISRPRAPPRRRSGWPRCPCGSRRRGGARWCG